MKAASFFSGVGGFDLGFERAGIETVLQCEIDASCRELLGKKFSALVLEDVRAISAAFRRIRKGKTGTLDYAKWQRLFELLGSASVWCGGFPCQDLSIAGSRAGLVGERSGLWYAFRRIIALFRPAWVVLENVPGLLSSHGGRDLAAVLGGLEKLGYRWAYRVLDVQFLGLAQRRERVFIVASLGDFRCAEVLFERESVCWDSPPSRAAREDAAEASRGGAADCGIPEIAGCLQERDAKGADSDTKPGHFIPVLASALVAKEGETHTNEGSGNFRLRNVVPILDAGARTGKSTTDERAGMGVGESGDPMFTLQAGKQHAVSVTPAIAFKPSHFTRGKDGAPGEVAPPLTADADKGDQDPVVRSFAGVRRLTPTEAERLQGFPDGWTRVRSEYRVRGRVSPCLLKMILQHGANAQSRDAADRSLIEAGAFASCIISASANTEVSLILHAGEMPPRSDVQCVIDLLDVTELGDSAPATTNHGSVTETRFVLNSSGVFVTRIVKDTATKTNAPDTCGSLRINLVGSYDQARESTILTWINETTIREIFSSILRTLNTCEVTLLWSSSPRISCAKESLGFEMVATSLFSDSTRYRMLGNAVAVPVANWIGKRLVMVASKTLEEAS